VTSHPSHPLDRPLGKGKGEEEIGEKGTRGEGGGEMRGEEKGGEGRVREGKGRRERGCPLTQIPGSGPGRGFRFAATRQKTTTLKCTDRVW